MVPIHEISASCLVQAGRVGPLGGPEEVETSVRIIRGFWGELGLDQDDELALGGGCAPGGTGSRGVALPLLNPPPACRGVVSMHAGYQACMCGAS